MPPALRLNWGGGGGGGGQLRKKEPKKEGVRGIDVYIERVKKIIL